MPVGVMGSGGVRNSQKSCVGWVSRLSSERNRNMHRKIKNSNSSEPPVHCTVLHSGNCTPGKSCWCVCLVMSIFPVVEHQILLLCFHSCYGLGMLLHFPLLIWLRRLHPGPAETSGSWLCTWILAALCLEGARAFILGGYGPYHAWRCPFPLWQGLLFVS